MCGDGTNDVGALIHSHFGVALLSSGGSNHPEAEQKKKAKLNEAQALTNEVKNASSILRNGNVPYSQSLNNQQSVANAQVKKYCKLNIERPRKQSSGQSYSNLFLH